jgi:hypothetical protein
MWKFNPLTESLTFIVVQQSGNGLTKGEVVRSFLMEADDSAEFPKAQFLFDADSLLFNDDEAL